MKATWRSISLALFLSALPTRACEEKSSGLETLRAGARAADQKDQRDFPVNYFSEASSHPSQFSPLRGTEWIHLNSSNFLDRAVLYLGSGPDVYRLVHDFPLAKEFHFLDLWTGWGASRQEVLDEAFRRLEQLASVTNASIAVESQGFLAGLSEETLRGKSDLSRAERNSHFVDEPILYRLDLRSADGAIDERRFYFHQINFSDAGKMRVALAKIQERRAIGACLTAGAPTPRWSARRVLRKSLDEGGVIVTETSDIDDSVKALKRLYARGGLKFRFGGRHHISGAGGGHNSDYYLKDLSTSFFMNMQTLIFEKE